jgi:DNA mismatch endonuclease (patch repair protein)
MDRLTKDERSRLMSRIRSKDTGPELKVRSLLHRLGFRFRLHRRDLPGRPDITLPKYRIVIFVHGCFWHRHPGCRRATSPKTKTAFWNAKFQQNVERDLVVRERLEKLGWSVSIVWQCELIDQEVLVDKLMKVIQ